jgi:glutathione S-transferase
MMALLDLPYETIDLDMANGAHKTSEFLKLNPLGQVPVIEDNGLTLWDSNAILVYLIKTYAEDDKWLPLDPLKGSEVQRWLSIAAGELAYGPCAVRLVKVFGADIDWNVAKAITDKVLAVYESTLQNSLFLTGEEVTLADIASYSYISHVPEGGVSLMPYPAIKAWLIRIEKLNGFVAMAPTEHP